jgi:hypothetical protein
VIRRCITVVTFTALLLAVALCVVWLIVSPYRNSPLEPLVNALVVLAALTGIFAERWAGVRQRRAQTLHAVAMELARNVELLADAAFAPNTEHEAQPAVFPRLLVSAADTALVSGALDPRRDIALTPLLHGWRDAATGLNRRLDLTESLMFDPRSRGEVPYILDALHREGGYLDHSRRVLTELTAEVSARTALTGP